MCVRIRMSVHTRICSILSGLHKESPFDSFHLLHTTALQLLAPFREEKTEAQKHVVICPKSLSKKAAELVPWMVCLLQDREAALSLGVEIYPEPSIHPEPRAKSAPLPTQSHQFQSEPR